MRKDEIVEIILNKEYLIGIKRHHIQQIIDIFFEEIISALKDGKEIELRGFGTFKVVLRKSRKIYDLSDLEKKVVPARKIVKFKPGTIMATRVRDKS